MQTPKCVLNLPTQAVPLMSMALFMCLEQWYANVSSRAHLTIPGICRSPSPTRTCNPQIPKLLFAEPHFRDSCPMPTPRFLAGLWGRSTLYPRGQGWGALAMWQLRKPSAPCSSQVVLPAGTQLPAHLAPCLCRAALKGQGQDRSGKMHP